jgi:hypothetical protein
MVARATVEDSTGWTLILADQSMFAKSGCGYRAIRIGAWISDTGDLLRPHNMLRLAFAAMTVWTVTAAGLTTPARAKEQPSVPVIGLVSTGTAVASRDSLAIGPVVVDIGMPAQTTQVTFRFQALEAAGGPPLLSFLAEQTDPACHTVGAVTSANVVECAYTRQVDPAVDLDFSFALRTTRPLYHGTGAKPAIRVTINVGTLSIGTTISADRVKPEADFVVAVKHPIRAHVGGIVDIEWTVTNVGLDPVWGHDSDVILTAPTGTRWVGPGLDLCRATTPSMVYRCGLGVTEPGAGKAHSRTWQLEILSADVGQGLVSARMFNATNLHPDDDFVDPTPENNTAAINVEIVPAPSSSPAASPSPAPGALPTTGSPVVPAIAGGILAVALGLLVRALARRRRVHVGSQ